MPVIIHRRTPPPPKPPGPRRRHFDQAVRKLAPMVAEVREAGHKSVEEIMHALNARRIAAPNGKVFTFGTTHRVLCRLMSSAWDLSSEPCLRRCQLGPTSSVPAVQVRVWQWRSR